MQIKHIALTLALLLPGIANTTPWGTQPSMLDGIGNVCLTPLQLMSNPRAAYSEKPIAAGISTLGHGMVLAGFYWTMLKLVRGSAWSNGDIRGVLDAMHFRPEQYYKTLKGSIRGGLSAAVLAKFLVNLVPGVSVNVDVDGEQAINKLVTLFGEVAQSAPFLFYLYLTHKGFIGGTREGLKAVVS